MSHRVRFRVVLTINSPAAWITLEKSTEIPVLPLSGYNYAASRMGILLRNASVSYDIDGYEHVVDFDAATMLGPDHLMEFWLKAGNCAWDVGRVSVSSLRGWTATVDAELCEWRASTLREIEKAHGIRIVPDRDLEQTDAEHDSDDDPSPGQAGGG